MERKQFMTLTILLLLLCVNMRNFLIFKACFIQNLRHKLESKSIKEPDNCDMICLVVEVVLDNAV
jgi:hypothetical protein